jgi:hypothetical protein
MAAIRIEMFKDRGWILSDTTQLLNPNYLPLSIVNTVETTFTASYRGTDYTFPIAALRRFLDDSDLYIPYPKYILFESFPATMKVDDTKILNVSVKCTNGQTFPAEVDGLIVQSSDPSVTTITTNELGANILTAIKAGEAIIKVSYWDDELRISKPVIVVDIDKELFPQSILTGQFPNGIN